jgi:hypothetical protein
MNGADIRAGRREAERRMVTQCTIARKGKEVLNEETGDYETEMTVVYSGRCKIRVSGLNVKEVDAAGQLLTVQQSILSLPMQAFDVRANDILSVVRNEYDDALGGMEFRIEGSFEQTFSTARRYSIERTK